MSDFDSTFINSDQQSIEEQFPVRKTPPLPALLVIGELATFMEDVARKAGVRMENQLIRGFHNPDLDFSTF